MVASCGRTARLRARESWSSESCCLGAAGYLREQKAEQICSELKLTQTQFRLIKSRAKARFGELGRARLAQRTGFLTKVK